MNNSRLSTSSDKFIIDSKTKYALEELIKLEPLISVNSEGRAMILKEHKYIRSTYIIQAVLPNGSISYFINDAQCAKYFLESNPTIIKRLNDGKPILKFNEIFVCRSK